MKLDRAWRAAIARADEAIAGHEEAIAQLLAEDAEVRSVLLTVHERLDLAPRSLVEQLIENEAELSSRQAAIAGQRAMKDRAERLLRTELYGSELTPPAA